MRKVVMVVDDDTMIHDLLRLTLQSAGYEVVGARDGQEAIEQLDTLIPSIILLDLMMPEMSGFQFAEVLRERGLRPTIPVLVLTAASQPWLKAQWIDADGYLEKPFEISTLLDRVARLAA